MYIKQKILKIYNSGLFACRTTFCIIKKKIIESFLELEQFKNKPSIKYIISLYNIHFDLTFRRLFAFIIDSLVIILFLLLIEFITCFIVLSNDDVFLFASKYFLTDSSDFFHKYFNWIIYVCVMGFMLSGIKGYSLGCRIFKIQVNWPRMPNRYLLVGSVLRALLPFYIPFIYFYLVFLSYTINLSPIALPKLESAVLIFLILIWPISIVISKGSFSIYDYIFYTKVKLIKCNMDIKRNVRSAIVSVLLSFLMSILLTTYFHASSLIERTEVLSEDYSTNIHPKIVNKSKVSALLYEKIIRDKNSQYLLSPVWVNRNSTISTGGDDDGKDFVKWNIIVLIGSEDKTFIKWLNEIIKETLQQSNEKINNFDIVLKKHMQINVVGITKHAIYQYDEKLNSFSLKEKYKTAGVNFMF